MGIFSLIVEFTLLIRAWLLCLTSMRLILQQFMFYSLLSMYLFFLFGLCVFFLKSSYPDSISASCCENGIPNVSFDFDMVERNFGAFPFKGFFNMVGDMKIGQEILLL